MSGLPLHEAIRQHDLATLQSLLINSSSSNPDFINTPDNMSRTPLHLAAWYGYTDIVQYLLSMKASYSSRAKDNFLPLHFAIISSSYDTLQLLLETIPTQQRSKLLNSKVTKNNKTALHLAANKMNYEVIKLLLESGCDPLALTKSGQTALDFLKEEASDGQGQEETESKDENKETSGGRKRKICEEKDEEKEERKRNYQKIYQLIKDTMEVKIANNMKKIQKHSSNDRNQHLEPIGMEAATSFSTLSVVESVGVTDRGMNPPSEPTSGSDIISTQEGQGEKIIKIDLNQKKKKKSKIGVQLSHLENDDDLL